ncbi:MAG: hypothetical protein RJA10_2665, partial [Pseudomonadota bacterium]
LQRLYGGQAHFELRTPADGLGGAEALLELPLSLAEPARA